MSHLPDDQLDRLFALSLDILCVAGMDGTFRRVNPAFTRILGHAGETVLGRSFVEYVHPADQAATVLATAQLAAGEQVLGFVNRYRCADGSYRFLEWTAYPSDGMIYGIARDIGGRRRTEEALRAREQRLRLILNRTLDAFVAMNEDGRVTEWNPQAESTFGWTRAEALGRTVAELIVPPAHRDAHTRGLARYIATGEQHMLDRRVEMEALHQSGRTIPIEISISALREEDGWTFIALMHDIGERTRSQGIRVQTAKLASLGEMVAGVAHEINNPLAFVSNNVAVLERDFLELRDLVALHSEATPVLAAAAPDLALRLRAAADEMDLPYTMANLERMLRRTREGLQRIRQIVRDLRDFARLDAADRQEADLNDGVFSTVNIVRGRARAQGVPDIELDLPPLPRLLCHPAKINQVIMNLLSNAIDASPPGAPVTVRTRSDEETVSIEVIDRGPGVPAELLDRIFDPFFTTKPPGKGTGLGLSISYGIVKDHGGTITVDHPPGEGTRFTVTLPRKQEP